MHFTSIHVFRSAVPLLAVLLTPAVWAQTTPTCNGLPATIVATAPGQIMGTLGDDVIVGSPGNDKIFGLAGNDTICGLGGDDQIVGGQGNDNLFGQEGKDTFVWSPGDAGDRIEGSADNDTLLVNGANVSEILELSANANRLRLSRNIGNVILDVADVERVDIEARGGSDTVTLGSLVGTGVQQVTLDLELAENTNTPDGQPDSIFVFGRTVDDQIAIAGSGNTLNITGAGPVIYIRNPEVAFDTLSVYGIEGHDRITAENLAAGLVKLIIEGGPGNDTITGSRGADSLVGGEDDDTFLWTLGQPADLMGGEAGMDTLHVLGSGVPDNVTVSAGALEAAIFNGVDGVNFLTDVEHVVLQVRSGADNIAISSLAGSAKLQKVTLDLRPSTTVSTGDGYPDTILVNGTNAADIVNITGAAGSLTLSGLAPTVVIQGSDYARDTLTVAGGFEADTLNAQGLAADVVRLVMRGGQGADMLTGSLGDDVFLWSPGDSSDVIEGLAGTDTLQFSGANIGENISLTANGSRLRFTRDVATVVLDVNAVERVTLAALGGPDTILLGDLSATAVRQVALDLGGPTSSAGDGQADTISITALTSNAIATTLGPGTMGITWAGVRYAVTGVEMTNDRFILQTAAGAAPAMISAVGTNTGGTDQ
jgi:Ca2+-binding RTX toxin-like protein